MVVWVSSVESAEPDSQLRAHARVERTERLVQQQHFRIDGERARQPHPLPLAAGELRRVALRETDELDELEQLGHALPDLGSTAMPDLQAERDVVPDSHVLEGRVELKTKPTPRAWGDLRVTSWPSSQTSPASGCSSPAMTRSSVDFPLPLGPEQRGERAFGNVDGHVIERRELTKPLHDAVCRDQRVSPLASDWSSGSGSQPR